MRIIRLGKIFLLCIMLLHSIGCTLDSRTQSRNLNDPNYDPVRVSFPGNTNQGTTSAFQNDEGLERKIETLPKIKEATVLVARQTAYVGLRMEPNFAPLTMTPMMRKKVTDEVRKNNPEIRTIYLSNQPEFLRTMQELSNRVHDGRPIRNLEQQLKNLVKRLSMKPEE